MSRQGDPVMCWRQLWMVSSMTTLVSDKVHLFIGWRGYLSWNLTYEIEYFITLPIPFTGLCNSVRIDKMLAKFKSQERKVHQTNDCDICKVQAKKLSSQIHNADKDLGQAHHMFSRFLNLHFFSQFRLCFLFLQGANIIVSHKTLQPSKNET